MKKTFLLACWISLLASPIFAQKSVMDFYNLRIAATKAALKKSGTDASNIRLSIKTQDVKNGFIAYDLPTVEGYEEMAYYIPTTGNKFVAVVSFGCGPSCSSGLPIFYEIANGQLVDKTEKYLPSSTAMEIEKGMEIAYSKLKLQSGENGLANWTKVPQKGTTIQIGFNEAIEGEGDELEKFHIIYELVYNKANASFKLVRK